MKSIDGNMNTQGGLSGFGITWKKFFLWIFSFIVMYHLIGGFGGRYARQAEGYEIGNRYRLVSVVRLEVIMIYLSIPIYLHLFSYFHRSLAESEILKNSREMEKLKKKCFSAFMGIMIGAHATYMFYLLPFDVPYIIYWPSALSLGLWMHLFFFTCLFMGGNTITAGLNKFEAGRTFVSTLCRIRIFKSLIVNKKVQVISTLISTVLLSVIQWYSSDKIVIKELDLRLKNYPLDRPAMNVALLTDLHGGAMVYRNQIANAVDKTNSIEGLFGVELDAVFIVGDAIDAPREIIEDRMEPLRHLKSRLGTYFVSGNHEFYYGNYDDWKKLFIDYGIRVLENDVEHLENAVCLVGLHDISAYKSGIKNVSMDESAISKCQRNESIIVLAHNPASTKRIMQFSKDSGYNVDLILSGHTHSGQYYILVPYVYWLLPYLYGLYPVGSGNTQLFVSAGTLYQAAPMKMVGRSEIWLLKFRG